MPQPNPTPQKGPQLGKKKGLNPGPKKPAVPRDEPIGLIGNRSGGFDGKRMPDSKGVRNGDMGVRKGVRGLTPAGRVVTGRLKTGGAVMGRLTPAAGARTTGACGARTTPGLAPPPWAPAAPRCANPLAGMRARAQSDSTVQIVLRLTAGQRAVGFVAHPPDPEE